MLAHGLVGETYGYFSDRFGRDGWHPDVELVTYVHEHGKLPVPNFAAGGIATPADAALCRELGAEAIFVGSGIFKSDDPEARARAIVRANTHWEDPAEILAASRGLAKAMEGIEMETLDESQRLANRGW